MSKLILPVLALSATFYPCFAISQESAGIEIYSNTSNPSNPIVIESNDFFDNEVTTSSLDGAEELSEEDILVMKRVFQTINEANTIDEIDQDDPLSDLSPDQRALFEAMIAVTPMTPDQIRMFKRRYLDVKNAKRENIEVDAQRSSRSIDLTLKPGEMPPTIRMEAGKVATVTFSDMNGNAWPILSVTTGDATAFSASTAGEPGDSNILIINPSLEYTASNMVVTLVDNPVPVLLTLDARDQKILDYRTDIRIDGKGPKSDFAITEQYDLPATNDSTMIAFLDGVPPRDSERRDVSSQDVEAWSYNGDLYIRTKGQVFSPAYTAKSSNISGVNVFVLPETPVVLVSAGGTLNTVSIYR